MSPASPLLTPTSDLFIASLWSAPANEHILRSLINSVMTDAGLPPIVKATVRNPYNIQDYSADKRIILDVRVEDESGTFYNVEVQRDADASFLNRMLFGWSDTYSSQLLWGEPYDELCPVRSIIITEFPIFPGLKKLHAVFELRSQEDPKVLFSDHCQLHVLRLGDLMRNKLSGLEQLGLNLQRWMQFWACGAKYEERKMSTILADSPEVREAYDAYKKFTSNPAIREQIMTMEREEKQIRLRLAGARKEGMAKGMAKGEAKGIVEGEAKGIAKGKAETARLMRQEGFDLATIARVTGLTPQEIERLEEQD